MIRALPVVLSLLLAACSAPPPAALSQPIINGTLDPTDPNVVLVFVQIPGQPGAALCSGEIVSPHVVLTAAHCVAPSSVGAGAQFTVFTGQSFDFTGSAPPPADQSLQVVESHYLPTWGPPTKTDDDPGDVGVLILAAPTDIPPLPYNHFDLPAKLVKEATQVRIVGFGLTDGSDKTGATAGTRHTAGTYLNFIRPQGIELWDNIHSNCEGDSGGPALMMLDGKERIAGITAFGYVGCYPGLASTSTRVDVNAAFVDGYVNMHDPPRVAPGGACTADSDCGALPCLSGICTAPCDPNATPSSCPAGTECTSVDDEPMCAKPHGCAIGGGGGSAGDAGALMLLVGALLLRRPRRRRA
jgi:MYXO-CTERM domain-containing protein